FKSMPCRKIRNEERRARDCGPPLIVDKPKVCQRDFPIACLRTVPQFSMVVPLRSQARLWHSLLHWAYFGLFRAQRAAFVRPAVGGPVFRRCALRVLAPSALRASDGQRPVRECI